jgi:hypothetical protein
MEVLLIDIGALAVFLGYIAIVYWHGATPEGNPATRNASVWALSTIARCPPARETTGADYLDRESATARSARSSVEIGQRASQPMQ